MRERNQQIINSTMAEIMMLLLFIFFLYLFYLFFENNELKKDYDNLLNKSLAAAKENDILESKFKLEIEKNKKLISGKNRLLRSIRKRDENYYTFKKIKFKLSICKENLAQNKKKYFEKSHMISKLNRELEYQEFKLENLRSEVKALKQKNSLQKEKIQKYTEVIEGGQGKKSCIRNKDDSVVSIFDVLINIRDKKFEIGNIDSDKLGSLINDVDLGMIKRKNKDGRILTKNQFVLYSKQLASHARSMNCKFYANIKFDISSSYYKGEAASLRSVFELYYIPANPTYIINYFR